MKYIKKTVPVTEAVNYEIKQVSQMLHISDATLMNFAILNLLSSIKKGTLKKSDLLDMILNDRWIFSCSYRSKQLNS